MKRKVSVCVCLIWIFIWQKKVMRVFFTSLSWNTILCKQFWCIQKVAATAMRGVRFVFDGVSLSFASQFPFNHYRYSNLLEMRTRKATLDSRERSSWNIYGKWKSSNWFEQHTSHCLILFQSLSFLWFSHSNTNTYVKVFDQRSRISHEHIRNCDVSVNVNVSCRLI